MGSSFCDNSLQRRASPEALGGLAHPPGAWKMKKPHHTAARTVSKEQRSSCSVTPRHVTEHKSLYLVLGRAPTFLRGGPDPRTSDGT